MPTNIESEIKYKKRYDMKTGRIVIDFEKSESEKNNNSDENY